MIKVGEKKRLFLITIAVVTVIAVSWSSFMKKDASGEDEVLREREYVATMGDIVVGIEAKGVVKLKREAHTFRDGAILGKYNVKVGDSVKKGDVLAELSMENLEKKKSEINDRFREAQNALSKARSDKELFESEGNKKVNDIKKDGEAAYNSKLSEINTRIDSINKRISSIQGQITALQDEKKKLEAESANEANSARIAEIKNELTVKEGELNSANEELATGNSSLSTLNSDRNREIKRENEDVNLLKRQNEAQSKSLQGALESAQSSFDKVNKELEEINELIASPKIEAKIDGVVLSTPYALGETIGAAKPVVEIGDMSKQNLTLFIDPVDVIEVSEGQQVSFYVDAYQEDTFTGKVESRSYVQNENKQVEVTVLVDENEAELLEGMGALATIISKEKKDVLTLSNKAITLKDNKQMVKVKNADGKIEEREITTGFSDGRVSEVLSGLEAGDVVVSEG